MTSDINSSAYTSDNFRVWLLEALCCVPNGFDSFGSGNQVQGEKEVSGQEIIHMTLSTLPLVFGANKLCL